MGGEKISTWKETIETCPIGWVKAPLGKFLKNRVERNHPNSTLLSVTAHGVVPRESLVGRDTSNEDKSLYLRVLPGDLAYNTMRMWQGRSALSDLEGIVSPAYTVCTPGPDLHGEYAKHLFKYPSLVDVFRGHSQGMVKDTLSLRYAGLASIEVILPPLPEQRRIAEILTSVDDAIRATQGVIDQTRRVKQGLLQELLTRGIGHTRFKQTEIGEVPEGWEVLPLGRFFPKGSIGNGLYKPGTDYGEGTPIIRIDSFHGGARIVEPPPKLVRASDEEVQRFKVLPGDVLINRVNSLSHLGKAALVGNLGETAIFESNMMRARLANDAPLAPEYLLELLSSPLGKDQIIDSAKQAIAQASINQKDVRAFRFPIPPPAEQRATLEVLDGVAGSISVNQMRYEHLTNLKSGLLQGLLTGRVRVGGAS